MIHAGFLRPTAYPDHVPIDYGPNQEWPPAALATDLAHLAEYGAWYRGDPEELWRWYARQPNSVYPQVRPSQLQGGMVGWVARAFWGRPSSTTSNPGHIHVPAASDIAALSSDLLFSEAPTFEVADGDDKALKPTEKYLQKVLTEQGGYAVFAEGAERTSAYGSVFLRAIVDTEVADAPFVDTVPAAAAVPDWRFGRLLAVTFWKILTPVGSDTVVWRHLERHERGVNWHALYKGTADRLGSREPLTAHHETKFLADLVGEGGSVVTGIDILDVAHWPNVRPNRDCESSPLGRSDYDAGGMGLFDGLDELTSLMLEDFRLARARVFVPEGYLRGLGPGRGATFDTDQRIFTLLRASDPDKPLQIEMTSFPIRVEEHLSGIAGQWRSIVKHAGLSADAFGEETGGQQATATEVGQRGARTVATRYKKAGYATPPLRHMAAVLLKLAIARGLAPRGVTFAPARIVWPDGVTVDPEKQARIVQLLDAAGAASRQHKVELANPDWDDVQVAAEVDRLIAQEKAQADVLRSMEPDAPFPADNADDGT